MLELINPDGLSTPASYTHLIAATGSRLVFVAGQVADDAQGNIVGPGDLAAKGPSRSWSARTLQLAARVVIASDAVPSSSVSGA